jgi:hypothetical protein
MIILLSSRDHSYIIVVHSKIKLSSSVPLRDASYGKKEQQCQLFS